MPDELHTMAELAGSTLAEVVIAAGGPRRPEDVDRDIYRETVEATQVDPDAEWQWTTCE